MAKRKEKKESTGALNLMLHCNGEDVTCPCPCHENMYTEYSSSSLLILNLDIRWR
jgi:hypothetical protein